MEIHHIGYLTKDINASLSAFQDLGYESNDILNDDIQQCKICLLYHRVNNDCIELVQPYETNTQMMKMLSKRGSSAYHICYEVEDVKKIFEEFCNKEGWMNIFKPVVAVALGNRLITYFYNINLGFVEFVNKK